MFHPCFHDSKRKVDVVSNINYFDEWYSPQHLSHPEGGSNLLFLDCTGWIQAHALCLLLIRYGYRREAVLSASCQVRNFTQFHTLPTITDHFQWLVHNLYRTCSALFQIGCSGPNTSHMIICSVTVRHCLRTSLSRPPSAFMTVSQTVKMKRAVKQLYGVMEGEPGKIHVCTNEYLYSKNIYSSILYILFRMYISCSISVHKKHIYVDIFLSVCAC